MPDALCDPPNERTTAPEPAVGGILLYLISLGLVAMAAVGASFGLGFFLLAHPDKERIVASGDRGVEEEPRRADIGSPPETDVAALTVQTEPRPLQGPPARSSPGQPPAAIGVLPPADRDTAWASFPAPSDVSSSRELGESRDEAAPATPRAATHAKSAGISRHRHDGGRKHWAGVSRPGVNSHPPPPPSGLEQVQRWIVQSATGILAALSPPPSRQAHGFKTH
jgi:hypothetical protein